MKATKTIYAHDEYTNEYGVKIENTVFLHSKTLSSGKVYEREYVWEEKIGDFRCCKFSYKSEKRMQKAMQEFNFYK